MHRRDLLGMMSLAAFADFDVLAQAPASSVLAKPSTTPPSVRARFAGLYTLVSYAPHGANPVGRIEYDRAGRMWALLHPPDRKVPAGGGNGRAATLEEYREMYRGMVAYYGSYDVNESAMQVTHHVQAASNPAWIGTDFVRWYKLEDNRITLSLNAEFRNPLVWERMPEQ